MSATPSPRTVAALPADRYPVLSELIDRPDGARLRLELEELLGHPIRVRAARCFKNAWITIFRTISMHCLRGSFQQSFLPDPTTSASLKICMRTLRLFRKS